MLNSLFRLAVEHSTRRTPWASSRWSPGLIDLRPEDWSVAAWITAEPGCTRTRTIPHSSGPGYRPFLRVQSVSNHSSMRWFFTRPSTARRPTPADFAYRVSHGPDLRSCSLHSLNRKSMTFFEPVATRLAPLHSLLWIARKRMRPDFLRAGLNEHRLKVRLRTPQSIVVSFFFGSKMMYRSAN